MSKENKVRNYDTGAIWYERLDALEAAAKSRTTREGEYIQELRRISRKDEDWRVRELAKAMVSSWTHEGDFSETEPYQEKLAERKRKAIKVKCKRVPYRPDAIWYDRLDQVKSLKGQRYRGIKVIQDLTVTSERDDDWRVREKAAGLLNRCSIKI